MGKNEKSKKIRPGLCDCLPLLGQNPPVEGTLICSACGFEADVDPQFGHELDVSAEQMDEVYRTEWSEVDRDVYRYFLELMKRYERKPLQAAREAFGKVQDLRKRGVTQWVEQAASSPRQGA